MFFSPALQHLQPFFYQNFKTTLTKPFNNSTAWVELFIKYAEILLSLSLSFSHRKLQSGKAFQNEHWLGSAQPGRAGIPVVLSLSFELSMEKRRTCWTPPPGTTQASENRVDAHWKIR